MDYTRRAARWLLGATAHPGGDFAFIAGLWRDWSPGYDGGEDVAHVRDSLRDPANLSAALGYYRAALGTAPAPPADPEIAAIESAGGQPSQPVLYLHGEEDGCIGVAMGRAAEQVLAAPSEVEIVPGCGHFLHLERPDVVNARILHFLAR